MDFLKFSAMRKRDKENALAHKDGFKYLKRYWDNGRWRYVYADSDMHSQIKTAQNLRDANAKSSNMLLNGSRGDYSSKDKDLNRTVGIAAGKLSADNGREAHRLIGQNSVRQQATNSVRNVSNEVSTGVRNASNAVSNTAKNAASTVSNGVRNTSNVVSNGVRNASNAVSNTAKNAASTVSTGVRNASNAVSNTAKNTATKVSNAVSKAKDVTMTEVAKAGEAVSSVKDSISNIFKKK